MIIAIPVRALHHFAKDRAHVLYRHLNSLQLENEDYRNQDDNNKDDDVAKSDDDDDDDDDNFNDDGLTCISPARSGQPQG